uniref:protein IMPAIRED IN BABA-INDUCED STERILITY 1-like n=1 Tax=Erigeron canadensis TaxID=72917 RepID=UPI001CB8FE84|nr:protein IMPAIRED IN BABA-INDUCED STERILITY 1-like [Erigeron canadensis]
MGCINSKHVLGYSSSLCSSSLKNHDHDYFDKNPIGSSKQIKKRVPDDDNSTNWDGDSINLKFGRLTEAEHVAAGWPSWLSAVAGEAIDGWLPLKAGNFERYEKVGQGTYSSVYRARHIEGGRMVALKKVRFDNSKPDSVKFMAREITLLRMLDHPNIMKLEGIITSPLSSHVYLVFEYMEHDLSGVLSSPDIQFNDSQIKCYMRQLLKGVEHCHSHGILHRDIKTSNILVNNKGILKIGDFGLAKFHSPNSGEPLTGHVVTLWYRPPELLLGCTQYGPYVDLWSVGCVFAELFLGKPILKGQTEVEQLHQIYKLCGTPPDEYWNKSKLPLAKMFKPHHAYESTLRERCKQLPETAVNLIEKLLSVEPCMRGSARSALESEYFKTKPYACDPASLPKYLLNKEIHVNGHEETFGKKHVGLMRASGTSRNLTRVHKTCKEPTSFCKVVPTEVNADAHIASKNNGGGPYLQTTGGSQFEGVFALPVQATTSNGGFMWATSKRKYGDNPIQSAGAMPLCASSQRMPENGESTSGVWKGVRNHRLQSLNQPCSFDSSKVHNSQDLLNDEEETFFDAVSQC